ncbi:MAG: nitroreductase family deazaflavin-dependent oxidoreductase [Solirubrobacteraceae bacterium]
MIDTSSTHPPAGEHYRTQREKTRIDIVLQAVARSRLGGWLFVHVFPVLDRRLIPLSHGRLKVAMGQPILLLHTRGARSGQPRATPLLYTPDGDAFIVVASKAGAQHHPAWYYNLRAHPDDIAIEYAGARVPVRARVADGAERARLWARVNDNYNGYDTYQTRATGRTIPIIVLQKLGSGGGRSGARLGSTG